MVYVEDDEKIPLRLNFPQLNPISNWYGPASAMLQLNDFKLNLRISHLKLYDGKTSVTKVYYPSDLQVKQYREVNNYGWFLHLIFDLSDVNLRFNMSISNIVCPELVKRGDGSKLYALEKDLIFLRNLMSIGNNHSETASRYSYDLSIVFSWVGQQEISNTHFSYWQSSFNHFNIGQRIRFFPDLFFVKESVRLKKNKLLSHLQHVPNRLFPLGTDEEGKTQYKLSMLDMPIDTEFFDLVAYENLATERFVCVPLRNSTSCNFQVAFTLLISLSVLFISVFRMDWYP